MISQIIKDKCINESLLYLLVRSQGTRQNAHGIVQVVDGQTDLGEVFTPTHIVLEMLENLDNKLWDAGKTYLDPTCGNGQFLSAVLIIKMELGHTDALSTIYGVDLMQDNVDECRQRLIDIAGDTPANWEIVKHNIRCEDGLTYDYSFKTVEEEQLLFDGKLEKTKKVKTVKEVDGPNELPSNLF